MYEFNASIASELQDVEETLSTLFHHDHIPWIHAIADHALLKKGKRLRASLILLFSGAFTHRKPSSELITLSSAIEMLHSAMLLHDDVIDGAFLRRLKPCVHRIWGTNASILMGDYIYAQCFLLIQKINHVEITASLARATANIIAGELKQQSLLHNPDISLEDYHFVIENKTAELFSVALSNTARLTDPSQIAWSENWGRAYGRLYQIVDDLIDIKASNDDTDKSLGQDIKQGLVTLPTLWLRDQMDEEDREKLRQMVIHSDQYDEATYHQWIKKYNIETQLKAETTRLSSELTESLKQTLQPSFYRDALIELVFCTEQRTH